MKSYNIREANINDLFDLAVLGKKASIDYKLPYKFNLNHWYDEWKKLFKSGIGKILVVEENDVITGGFGFLIYNDINSGIRIAQELFWYIDSNKRGLGIKLFKAFEDYIKAQECKMIITTTLASSMFEKVERFYEKYGYKILEKQYYKEV